MMYNFDEITDRSDTACVKYDLRKEIFGAEEVIPMWVADMDFKTPDFILDAIRKRTEHPVLGYSIRNAEYFNAVTSWISRHHDWEVQKEWVSFSPGIVPALNFCVLAYTKPGDRIIVQPPVYFPFFGAVKDNGRVLSQNPLKLQNGRYYMDFADLEKQCKKGAAMILICNPQNPGGSAWTKEELLKLAEICLKYNVLMVSDEIHSDLVNVGYKHTVLASLGKKIADSTITMMAPSKTFNLAALSTASVIISNPRLRKKYNALVQGLHVDMGNVFGNVASIAAYTKGDQWLKELLVYIDGNLTLLEAYLKQYLPQIKMIRPEATYMAWLDCSALNMTDKELNRFFVEKAKLGLNPGALFGKGGEQFMRINVACPRSVLQQALVNLKSAVNSLKYEAAPVTQ